MSDSKFIRWPELNALLDVSRETVSSWEKKGIFPQRINLGPNTVAWERDKVDSWIESKMDNRDV